MDASGIDVRDRRDALIEAMVGFLDINGVLPKRGHEGRYILRDIRHMMLGALVTSQLGVLLQYAASIAHVNCKVCSFTHHGILTSAASQ